MQLDSDRKEKCLKRMVDYVERATKCRQQIQGASHQASYIYEKYAAVETTLKVADRLTPVTKRIQEGILELQVLRQLVHQCQLELYAWDLKQMQHSIGFEEHRGFRWKTDKDWLLLEQDYRNDLVREVQVALDKLPPEQVVNYPTETYARI